MYVGGGGLVSVFTKLQFDRSAACSNASDWMAVAFERPSDEPEERSKENQTVCFDPHADEVRAKQPRRRTSLSYLRQREL